VRHLPQHFITGFFQNEESERIILNLGGMANITILPASKTKDFTGFDTGPGNALMDDWVQRHLNHDFDRDGQWAMLGQCHQKLLSILFDESYFAMPPPKSTGRDFFLTCSGSIANYRNQMKTLRQMMYRQHCLN